MSEFIPSGGGSDAKRILYRPSDEEGQPLLYVLTMRQTALLLANTIYLRWKNRYAYLPPDLVTQEQINDYIDSLDKALMVEIEFCSYVIDCLDNDMDVREAVTRLISEQGVDNPSVGHQNPEWLERGWGQAGNPTCDETKLKRQCRAFIERVDKINVQFFELLQVANNSVDLANQIANLPFLNLITKNSGVQSVIDLILYVTNVVKEQYDAGQTDDYKDELALRFFCYVQDDCKITYERFFQFTAENINQYIPTTTSETITTINQILETLFGLDLDGTLMVDLMYWLAGITAKVISVVSFGKSDAALDFMMTSAANDATYDVFGDPNCRHCIYWDFAIDPYAWSIITGSYGISAYSGNYAYLSAVSGSETFVTIKYTFSSPIEIRRVEFKSFHPDMYVTIETDDGFIVNNEYNPALNKELFTYNTKIDVANWMEIKLRRDVPDGLLEIGNVKMFYHGDIIEDAVECSGV